MDGATKKGIEIHRPGVRRTWLHDVPAPFRLVASGRKLLVAEFALVALLAVRILERRALLFHIGLPLRKGVRVIVARSWSGEDLGEFGFRQTRCRS
jgi:hypothetical protein